MRGGRSNHQKTCGHGKQNECAKISTATQHDVPLRQEWRKAPESWASTAGRKLYRSRRGLLFHSGAAAQTGLPSRPADEQKKSAGAAEASRNHSCELISLL